jgi:RHS repeat-associated protein
MVALNGNLTQGQECGCRSQATSERFVSLCLGGETTDSLPAGRCSPASRGKLLIIERIADAYGNTIIITANWGSDSATQPAYGANDIIFCGYPDRGIATAVIGTGLYDPETQLYYVRNRTYSPPLGRWIQRDPIGHASGMNLYGYVGARAVVTSDPNGTGPGKARCCKKGKGDCCGADITLNLLRMAGDVHAEWSVLSDGAKLGLAAVTAIPNWKSANLWDISGMAQGGAIGMAPPCENGRGKCQGTVMVAGKCYQQGTVNYWLAGLIYDALAGTWFTLPAARIFWDEVLGYAVGRGVAPGFDPGIAPSPVRQKLYWFAAGLNGNPASVPPPKEFEGCEPCSARPSSPLCWHWDYLSGCDGLPHPQPEWRIVRLAGT